MARRVNMRDGANEDMRDGTDVRRNGRGRGARMAKGSEESARAAGASAQTASAGEHAAASVVEHAPTSVDEQSAPSAVEHAAVRIEPPAASNEHVRKSMKGNKRANTKPELLMRERLRAAGLSGYRLQWKVPGHPDIAWPGKKVALFVNGCFWHRCPHCHPATPKTHTEYWSVKFERNVERDKRTRRQLEEAGWRVHVVWECQLKKKTIDDTLNELFPQLARELGKELTTPDATAGDSAPDASVADGDSVAPAEDAAPAHLHASHPSKTAGQAQG